MPNSMNAKRHSRISMKDVIEMLTAQVAQYAATLENYNKAIQIYEQVCNFITEKMTL